MSENVVDPNPEAGLGGDTSLSIPADPVPVDDELIEESPVAEEEIPAEVDPPDPEEPDEPDPEDELVEVYESLGDTPNDPEDGSNDQGDAGDAGLGGGNGEA